MSSFPDWRYSTMLFKIIVWYCFWSAEEALVGQAKRTVSRTGQTATSFGDIWVEAKPLTAIVRSSLIMLQTTGFSLRRRAGFISVGCWSLSCVVTTTNCVCVCVMYVCMYVCVCVCVLCMHVYVHVCVCVCACVCTHVCVYTCMYVHVCAIPM